MTTDGQISEQRGTGGLSGVALLAVVALAGAGTMVVELGAVRLIAPWFGASSAVWTNVIGVVLAALALGYALGARLALGADPAGRLGGVLLLAGAFAAGLPLAARPVAEAFMPEAVALHAAADALVWGSLAASLVLFLPAAAALGSAGPLAVEVLQRIRGGSAGAAGGRVLALSTLGSLAGTFGTTHLLVPGLGVTGTFLAAAGVLGGSGVLLLVVRRQRPGPGTVGAAILLALTLGLDATGAAHTERPTREGETLLAQVESELQSLRVTESGEGAERSRALRVNESLDSFQSVWTPEPGLLPPGHYYNHFALPYAWRTRELGAPPEGWRTLVIGLGAGTTVRVLEGVVQDETEFATVGIELDPAVVRLAREHFDLAPEGTPGRVAVGGLDGRAALRHLQGSFDEIVVDAYANNMEIPPHIATVEAFTELRDVLNDGGWVAVNVGGFDAGDPVLGAVANSLATAFWDDGGAFAARVPFSRNWVVFARRGGRVPRPGSSSFGARGARLVGGTDTLVRALELPGAWIPFTAGDGPLLTDDKSPTEVLQERSIERAAARLAEIEAHAAALGELTDAPAPAPSAADREREAAARALLAREEYVDALEAASEIEADGQRLALEAEVRWRGGAPFDALEVLVRDPGRIAGSAVALRLVADIALSVGAGDVAAAATERLHAAVERGTRDATLDAGAWWAGEVARLQASAADGHDATAAITAAVRRSRWAVGLAAATALLVLGSVLREPRCPVPSHAA